MSAKNYRYDSGFSFTRVGALILRYTYLLRSSWPRLLELVYWPTVQMLTWGFIQVYISGASGRAAFAAGTLIGAMLLWDVLFRSQLGFSVSFLEEIWARNIGNLLMSPMRPSEFIAALIIMSLVRLAIGLGPVAVMATIFFGFNYFALGISAALFFANLVLTGWAVGLFVSGLVMRLGLGAESLAWTVMFVLLPLTSVYYPVTILPAWLQPVAWSLPPTYVFEGLRALLIDHQIRFDLMAEAFALNIVLFAAASLAFRILLEKAREAGSLMQMGE
ncbi:MAG: ABC transporter permease [Alphaproteobacteria bacterium]|jgi:ABC-2 type transport system permease protein|nr:ABC transporter permease [Alphaproteobacteria bacterium]